MISLKALITGASGFVGTFMTQAVMNKGMEVLGISRTSSFVNGKQTNDYKCDILDKRNVSKVVQDYRPDLVIHLAGPAFIPYSFNQPKSTYDIIFNGTLNLLECIRELKISPKVLYVSSADVYGARGNGFLSETEICEPTNPYSSAKACAELLCRQFHHSYGMQIVVARPFNHTGPGQSSNFVCSDFACQVAAMRQKGENTLLTGNIDVKRDFLDVRDVVEAYMCLLEKGTPGEIYNVCSGKATLIRDIITILFQEAGISDYEIITDSKKTRQNDISLRVGDNTKFRVLSNWSPQFSLKQTISDLFHYWEENLHVKK